MGDDSATIGRAVLPGGNYVHTFCVYVTLRGVFDENKLQYQSDICPRDIYPMLHL